MKFFQNFFFLWMCTLATHMVAHERGFDFSKKTADLVVYSYDRPLQLYAFLESSQKYISGLENVFVIYRTSSERFYSGYELLKTCFPKVNFIHQGKKPRSSFKALTLQYAFQDSNNYILFAVDDIIVTDFIPISRCVDYLEKTEAYAFYFRLGKNIKTSPIFKNIQFLSKVDDGVYTWNFKEMKDDLYWGYPNSLDLTLFKKSEILNLVKKIEYNSPNTFEGYWHANSNLNVFGLCFEKTKIINIPMNRVQEDCGNAHYNLFTKDDLLSKFLDGYKMDIEPLFQSAFSSPHSYYKPTFIKR
jgi:hypothetical protein